MQIYLLSVLVAVLLALSSLVRQIKATIDTDMNDNGQDETRMEVNVDIINNMMQQKDQKTALPKQTDVYSQSFSPDTLEVGEQEDGLLEDDSLPPLDSLLAEESLDPNMPRPPIVLVPGLVSSRLIAWKYKKCRGPDIQVQDIVWLNIAKLMETMTYDPHCLIDCLKLGKNGTDPTDCRIRSDQGLDAIGQLSPGNIVAPSTTSIFTPLIRKLAQEYGYDSNNLHGAPYDWRLAPIQMENRDRYFTHLKFLLDNTVSRNKRPAIIIAHSFGNNLFLYFCEWLRIHYFYEKEMRRYKREAPSTAGALDHATLKEMRSRGRRKADKWIRTHVYAFVGMAAPLLGTPGTIKSVISGHNFGTTLSDPQSRELQLTYASTHFMNARSPNSAANKPFGAVNNKHDRKKFFPYDFDDTLLTITKDETGGGDEKGVSANTSVSIHSSLSQPSVTTRTFDISNVEDGSLFKYLADEIGDYLDGGENELLKDKYSVWWELFKRDKMQPIHRLYRRPPIRHIIMTYGVDLPTELAYEYTLHSSTTTDKSSNGNYGDALEGQKGAETVQTLSLEDIIIEKKYCDEEAAAASSDGVGDSTGSQAQNTTTSSTGASNTMLPIDISSHLAGRGPLVDTRVGVADLKSHRYTASAAAIDDQFSRLGDGMRAHLYPQHPESENQHCLIQRYRMKNPSNKNRGLGGLGLGLGLGKNSQLKYMKDSNFVHSGDATVPYLSLSYAKKWLEDGDSSEYADEGEDAGHAKGRGGRKRATMSAEGEHALKTKSFSTIYHPEHVHPSRLGSLGLGISMDPAIEEFNAVRNNGDTTSVWEINEVDHLDIAKHEFVLNKLINQLTKHMTAEFSVAYRNNNGKTGAIDAEEEAMAISDMLLTTMPVHSEEERDSSDTVYAEQDAEQEEYVGVPSALLDSKRDSNRRRSAVSRQSMSLRDAANDYFRAKMLRLAEIVNSTAKSCWLALRDKCVEYIS